MKITLSIILSLALSMLSFTHEYHVSITQIDYNTQTTTLQLSVKLHDGDVKLLLEKNLEGTINLENDLAKPALEEFLIKYLNTSLKLRHEGEDLSLKLIGKELEQDDLYIYLESDEIGGLTQLEVKNTLFLELFDDQSNMVHLSKDNQVIESSVFNKLKRDHSFTVK